MRLTRLGPMLTKLQIVGDMPRLLHFKHALHVALLMHMWVCGWRLTNRLENGSSALRADAWATTYIGDLYYITMSITMVGYGDIVPVGVMSRLFAVFLMSFAILFNGTVVSVPISPCCDSSTDHHALHGQCLQQSSRDGCGEGQPLHGAPRCLEGAAPGDRAKSSLQVPHGAADAQSGDLLPVLAGPPARAQHGAPERRHPLFPPLQARPACVRRRDRPRLRAGAVPARRRHR
mmetsp:Transcript_139337/g.445569  ORF Transcript_139337/g.445569 Transcript_139337/m.445569 type:complete len:233 (-) Transcript_139337:902-1600(-)